ncbi:MAG: DUF4390 domain-containing protein [Burkholderiaceae bacterium]
MFPPIVLSPAAAIAALHPPVLLLQRWLLAAALGLVMALLARPVLAEGIELSHLATQRSEDGLELSFSTRFELPRAAEDALLKGVPIFFTAEAAVFRNRWYWRDLRVSHDSRTWRLAWQPLTRQYKVSTTSGLKQSQNFNSLPEALVSLRGLSGWRVAEPREIEDDGRYYLEFSYKLDISQLPRPMQIGLGSSQGWGLGIERTLGLNPDFSAHTATP